METDFTMPLALEEIRVVCMDCGVLVKEAKILPPRAVSHGLCGACERKRQLEEAD